jgi:hypothetical protein
MADREYMVVPLKFIGYDTSELKMYKIIFGENQGYKGTIEKILNDLYSSDWKLVALTPEDNRDEPTVELIFHRSE